MQGLSIFEDRPDALSEESSGDEEVGPAPRRSGIRTVAAWTLTALACLLVWICLVGPNELGQVSPGAFVRLPLEALVFVGAVLLLPPRAGRTLAVMVGVVLGLLAIVKVLDMGFTAALGRPFNPEVDWSYVGSASDLLRDSIGGSHAVVAMVVAAAAAVAVLVFAPLSVLRLTRAVDRHRATSRRAVLVLGVVWVLCAVLACRSCPARRSPRRARPVSPSTRWGRCTRGIKDQQAFASALAVDSFRDTPGADLLTGLRGKDVIVAFVESYGRVAVQDSTFSPPIDAVLDAGTRRLRAAGFSAKSAFLTSPTFGGISWLAHSTLQSGLWIDNQQRYDQLVTSDRFTLSDAFKRAGWRTVADVPSDTRDWPEGTSFYHYDQIYDSRNVGYAGPKFSYATVPDQYTLAAFQRARARQGRPRSGDGRDRPRVEPHPVDPAAAHGRLEPASATARSTTACPRRGSRRRSVWRDSDSGAGVATGSRSSTR